MQIGFAGLGRMGYPMAANLVAAGHSVFAFDPAASDIPDGVRLVEPAELARGPVSISMLPNGPTTRQLVSDGLCDAPADHLHVVMGTVGPDVVRDLAERSAAQIIDAPVSGSVAMAQSAAITTMVGASAQQFAIIQPILAAMTAAQFHAGPVGAGSIAKLAVNTVLAGLSEAIAEGLLIAEHGGLDLDSFYDILSAGAVGAPYVGYKRDAFLSPSTTPVAAPVSLIQKDLTLALELADRHGLDLPGARAANDVLTDAVSTGFASADMAEVLTVLKHKVAATSANLVDAHV
ncbi:NAD(P)-dependent oxidoreductase [Gordonia sp. TBRC 11910]|uniref:NAD(P)-dependent oxidoreductase n=1 Tax=Gordonia asplenii TaxID=2725283 RepID=A0A848KR16_9ACTN|nr:NAD(P)-dependent oxidoreductase [Gordonia asplenii]NMO00692.1 NAD(P)-dependent oxidoreductase [Gordonia asplenii]